ncbi:MAG: phage tail assembly protein [Defluviitaleaceae bacterium]|nr:phage tail assembly protein [Defluviitaleaceae bacterium]
MEDTSKNTNKSADKQNTAADSGTYVHTFKKPFKFDDTEYKTMNFHFDRLKGEDMIKIESEMTDNNEIAVAAEVSKSYQARLAARAAKIGSDVIAAMPVGDFNAITNAARRFLLGMD